MIVSFSLNSSVGYGRQRTYTKAAERHFVLLPHTRITMVDLESAKEVSEEEEAGI